MDEEKILCMDEEEIKKARRKYMNEWRHKNADKVKAYQDKFWAKKAAEYNQESE